MNLHKIFKTVIKRYENSHFSNLTKDYHFSMKTLMIKILAEKEIFQKFNKEKYKVNHSHIKKIREFFNTTECISITNIFKKKYKSLTISDLYLSIHLLNNGFDDFIKNLDINYIINSTNDVAKSFTRHMAISCSGIGMYKLVGIDQTKYNSFVEFLKFLKDILENNTLTQGDVFLICITIADIIQYAERQYFRSKNNNKLFSIYKNSKTFKNIPLNVIDEIDMFSSVGTVILNYEKSYFEFEKYSKFIGVFLSNRKLPLKKNTIFKTITDSKKFNNRNKNFSEVDDLSLGIIMLQTYYSKKPPVWPFSSPFKWLKKYVDFEKLYKDKDYPYMLPKDLMRLHVMMNLIVNPLERIKFCEKFYNINFSKMKADYIIDWCKNKKYINKNV